MKRCDPSFLAVVKVGEMIIPGWGWLCTTIPLQSRLLISADKITFCAWDIGVMEWGASVKEGPCVKKGTLRPCLTMSRINLWCNELPSTGLSLDKTRNEMVGWKETYHVIINQIYFLPRCDFCFCAGCLFFEKLLEFFEFEAVDFAFLEVCSLSWFFFE